ncbi:hypothetical protein [Foetidibacter luteolus]|uniref:hypothetical protein n=1 Tax=Foetidibacter luteolus TaxID=2608880 RepID=UPI00129A1F7E|nr:hypothetical protein [Foetidibacter luteolus]
MGTWLLAPAVPEASSTRFGKDAMKNRTMKVVRRNEASHEKPNPWHQAFDKLRLTVVSHSIAT